MLRRSDTNKWRLAPRAHWVLCVLLVAASRALPAVCYDASDTGPAQEGAGLGEQQPAAASAEQPQALAVEEQPPDGSVQESAGGDLVTGDAMREPNLQAQPAEGGDAAAKEDRWWEAMSQDASGCAVEDAGLAKRLSLTRSDSSDACEAACRVTDGCNAWFFCEDDRGCYDWQTQLSVELSQCVLMAASTRPQPEPQRSDLARPLDFSSYQAGYLKGDLYLRPPHVLMATAISGCDPEMSDNNAATWQRADWLNRLSVANKQDFARLHGFRFMLITIQGGRPKIRVIEDVLQRAIGFAGIGYVIWAEQNAMIVNPAFAFSFDKYRRAGKDVVMYGETPGTLAGDVALFNPGVLLIRNTAEAREFFARVRRLTNDAKRMAIGLQRLKRMDNYRGSERTYRNAMAYMFASNPDKHLANVFLEDEFCIACNFKNDELGAPTMFATHFTGTTYCNEFSLAPDDDFHPGHNQAFVDQYRFGRCTMSQAVDHADPRSIVDGVVVHGTSVSLQAAVVVPGKFNVKESIAACRHSCRATQDCNAWVYCWRPGGCDDGREFHPDWYPYQACELYSVPDHTPLDMAGRGPAFSSFAQGFIPPPRPNGMPLYKIAPMFLEYFRAPSSASGPRDPNVVLITAIPTDPCQFPTADYINKLSVVNKQDYARLHNFELHISSEIDPNVTAGNWNKETVIVKTLAETPPEEAEWIMWVDIDTIIADMTIVPRFDEYEGADLIVWGQRNKLMEGNLNEGINCGVLLIRNTDWSREFFADVIQYAYMPREELQTTIRPVLEKEVFPLLAGYYDTPFIVWLLKTQAKYNTKVFLEDQLGINRHWMQMEWGEEEVDTLITHYAGCTFCKPPVYKLSPEIINACSTEFFKAFAYSKCTLEGAYRSLTPNGRRDGSYLAPDCEYEQADLSNLRVLHEDPLM